MAAPGDGSMREISAERIRQVADFRAALRAFERHVEQAVRRHGLTPQRFLLLLQIEGVSTRGRPVTVGEVAERLRLSANSVTELATRAEGAGLVRREPSRSDARAVHLRLTPLGRRRLRAALRESERYRQELRDAFEQLIERFEATA